MEQYDDGYMYGPKTYEVSASIDSHNQSQSRPC